MTRSGLNSLKRATSCGISSASTCAVLMSERIPCSLIYCAMASHFDFVRLAIMISLKTSAFFATFTAATVATPPAPMMSTFPIFSLYVAFQYAFLHNMNRFVRIYLQVYIGKNTNNWHSLQRNARKTRQISANVLLF